MKRRKPLKSDPEKVAEWRRKCRLRHAGTLKRSMLERKTRIKAKRRTKAQEDARFRKAYGSRPRRAAIAALPCAVPGCTNRPSENHHLHPGRDGRIWQNVVPLCRDHHTAAPDSYHALGSVEAFDREHTTDLETLAARLVTEIPA